MRYTLLEIVQRILASMDSDEVDSISDTTESAQVALLVEGVYYDLVAECNIPTTGTLFELEESGDATVPVKMTIPDPITSVEWVKYNAVTSDDDITTPNWKTMEFMELEEFHDFTNNYRGMDGADTYDLSIDNQDNTDTITFHFLTDRHPTYYTTYNDSILLFDSHDITEDPDYLLQSKTQCWGSIAPEFTQDNSFTPDLNPLQFSLLMNEAKARAFVELKQANNINAEGHARRLRVRLRNSKRRSPYDSNWPLSSLPNYGRK
jgi:hypothetical protein